jgi:hypothetical protein
MVSGKLKLFFLNEDFSCLPAILYINLDRYHIRPQPYLTIETGLFDIAGTPYMVSGKSKYQEFYYLRKFHALLISRESDARLAKQIL